MLSMSSIYFTYRHIQTLTKNSINILRKFIVFFLIGES